MENLCPFFKGNCHGNQCKMWHGEECLIVTFLQRIQEGVTALEGSAPLTQEPFEGTSMILHREEEEIPEWLKTASQNDIAEDIIGFIEKEFPEQNIGTTTRARSGIRSLLQQYRSAKGIPIFMPSEISMKIYKAEIQAETELIRKGQAEKKRRYEKEKEELPSLVGQYVDWARERNIRRATLTDVSSFVSDKEIDILNETKRDIFHLADARLRAK